MKNKISSRYKLLVLFIILSTQLQAQNVYSLKQCIDTAIKKNLSVNQRRFQQEKNKIYWQQSKLDLLPSVSTSVSQGLNLGRSIDPFTNSYTTQEINSTGIGIGTGLTLFNGFSLQSSIKQRVLSWEAAEQSVEEQKDNIALTVILAYLQVLTNEELLDQAKNQLAVSSEQLKRMESMDVSGAIKPSELSDVKGQYLNDEITIINTENNIKTAKINLCKILNIPYTSDFEVEKMNTDVDGFGTASTAREMYDLSLQTLPNVKAAELREKSTEWFVKSEKGKLWPTLRFGANINTNYSSIAANSVLTGTDIRASNEYVNVGGTQYNVYKSYNNYESVKIPYFDQIKNNRYTNLFVSLQIPLFNNFALRNNVRLAKIDLKDAKLQTQAVKTALQLEVEQAWENQKTSLKEFAAMQNQVKAYETSFSAATARFNEGVGTSIDYLTTKNNLDRVNSNLIITKYTLLLRTKILEYYDGKKMW
jgi:outer membrane protein